MFISTFSLACPIRSVWSPVTIGDRFVHYTDKVLRMAPNGSYRHLQGQSHGRLDIFDHKE